ncbi:MAG: HAD family phosphatase [Patescibacteria group bacterium]|nr:HAD family phosphatase [Patescibacteria group bacterium]
MKKKVAIFDIDGTIFRSSLLIELTDALIQEGIFSQRVGKEYARSYKNWLDRKDVYDKYVRGVVVAFEGHIKGVKEKDFLRVAETVAAFHRNRMYRYTREMVKDLKKKGYFLLAISHSPEVMVNAFCRKLGFDKVYGRIYEVDSRGRLTGRTIEEEVISDKSKMLKHAIRKRNLTLKGSLGVGDSESDIRFLRMVEKPICFNPNSKLYAHAKRAGWKIVVERKDVIYTIE